MKKRKRKGTISIKFKLILFTGLLILVLTAVNLVTSLFTSYQGILSNVRADLASLGAVADLALSSKVQNLTDDIKDTAELGLSSASSAELEKLAKKKGFLYLAVSDGTGIIRSGPIGYEGDNIGSQDLLTKAMGGETVISSPYTDGKGEFVIQIYTPMNGKVLIAGIDGMYLSSLVRDFRVGKSGNIFMIDSQGTVIANMRPELVQEQRNFIEMSKTDSSYKSAARVYSKMITGATGVDTYSYAGVKRICYYSPVSGSNGWYFGAVAPINEMTSSIRTVMFCLLGTSLIMMTAGIILAVLFAGGIANPIIKITNRMKLLSQGNLTEETPQIKSRDEVGELSKSIDSSIKTLFLYVEDITRNMEEIAAGNLKTGPAQEYIGDFKRIETAVYDSVRNLSETLSLIHMAAEQVSTGASQVAYGAQDLASGSTEQASAIEELEASIEKIAEQALDNSCNVKMAAQFVEQTGSSVSDGDEHMSRLTEAMTDISAASDQITSITKVIEDIAFQTNILALNAAVEAARAGDAGKGFAVVADEVRNLASKSSEAAKKTAELIQHSAATVAEGSQIAEQAAKILRSIRENAVKVNESIVKIEQASVEQSDAIEQIKLGLSQVSAVVQTNAATAEENSATSQEMSAQAATLRMEVEKFKLNTER
ncbi:methyl-accepting chemotaxis protein [Lacrimispora saccharolytica]|uniref:Methyl-accepting chemotaxis sensory transducer n=1 Tax=Lacrimispora saccharolytica (strain ATCC 35040 / DSM 2544 / NRCC 2533 / WM1) TaxID=610130 RepID=D9R0J3_LACSW|nr:methyl-accepting chemotaxis protein [Lacrimispora saccharolytica]ADL06426.1 methyl-accepting chemotaxis sensory transducer [[Clostridium] saccharolyticum WM1]